LYPELCLLESTFNASTMMREEANAKTAKIAKHCQPDLARVGLGQQPTQRLLVFLILHALAALLALHRTGRADGSAGHGLHSLGRRESLLSAFLWHRQEI